MAGLDVAWALRFLSFGVPGRCFAAVGKAGRRNRSIQAGPVFLGLRGAIGSGSRGWSGVGGGGVILARWGVGCGVRLRSGWGCTTLGWVCRVVGGC